MEMGVSTQGLKCQMQLDRLEEAKLYLVDQEVPMEMGVSTQDPKG